MNSYRFGTPDYIYAGLDNEFLPIKVVQKVPGSNPTGCNDILDSIVDFILTNLFEFRIKSYKYCENFSEMENQVMWTHLFRWRAGFL